MERTLSAPYLRERRIRRSWSRVPPCTLVRYGAVMAATRPHTRDFSQEARERLGLAVKRAREALPASMVAFAAQAPGISKRSLVYLEKGEPVGPRVYEAAARAFPNWTVDTPMDILMGGPIPSPVKSELRPLLTLSDLQAMPTDDALELLRERGDERMTDTFIEWLHTKARRSGSH